MRETMRAVQRLTIAILAGGLWLAPSMVLAQSSPPTTNTPATDTIGATLSVPLPLARRIYRGELDAATAAQGQAAAQLRTVELMVAVEVRQALARYQATVDRLKLYTGGILTNADKVLDSMTYNYVRGGATLLEVLEAQRTVDDVYLAYYQALTDHAHALVAVEQAAGIWDLRL